MSPGILQRIERKLLEGWHHLDHSKIVRIIMLGYDRLSADLDKAIAENADLKQQLAAAEAKPTGGATEDQLNALADKLEAAMSGSSSAKPDLPVSVGSTSTTVTDPTTGNTTTVDHATGTAMTTDASGTPVETDTAAANAAAKAAQQAGVPIDTSQLPAAA